MLINIGFITAFGIVAYQIIDNFGHLGGLLAGAIYGFIQIPKDLHKNSREAGIITKIFGLIAVDEFVGRRRRRSGLSSFASGFERQNHAF